MVKNLNDLKFSLHKKEEFISALEVVLATSNYSEFCEKMLIDVCKENNIKPCRKAYIELALCLGISFNEELPINKIHIPEVAVTTAESINNKKLLILCSCLGALWGIIAGIGYSMAKHNPIFVIYGLAIGTLVGVALGGIGLLLGKLHDKDIEVMKNR